MSGRTWRIGPAPWLMTLCDDSPCLFTAGCRIVLGVTESWTTAQAAAYCGINPSTFRDYVSDGRAPQPMDERDPVTGAKLYDADAVRDWHEHRPGKGTRTDLKS
jgi:hypothetical protein